jgi:hypothetical protein
MNSTEAIVTQLNGLVKGFSSNKHGDVDAIEFETDKDIVQVHFPPHTAKKVMEMIAVGQRATADYATKIKPDKKPELELKSIKKDQQDNVLNVADRKPEKATADSLIEVIKPERFTLIRDKKEEPVAILADNKLIHLHKEDKEVAAAIRPDSVLIIQAVLRTDEGFVNEQNLPVYHIKSIDVDGHSFRPSKKK